MAMTAGRGRLRDGLPFSRHGAGGGDQCGQHHALWLLLPPRAVGGS